MSPASITAALLKVKFIDNKPSQFKNGKFIDDWQNPFLNPEK
jgi:hypothetical protein